MLLYGQQIWQQLCNSAALSVERAWIASAYVTSNRLEELCSAVPESVYDKCILVRWQKADLICGASDLESYLVAKRLGWRFFVNLNLHAKMYIFDNDCMSGSANLTYKGMCGVSPPGNHEVVESGVNAVEGAIWYSSVIKSSCEINDNLFENISKSVQSAADNIDQLAVLDHSYDGPLTSVLTVNSVIELSTKDMFWSKNVEYFINNIANPHVDSDVNHDMELLGIVGYEGIKTIGEKFLVSKAFQWLLKTVDGEIYFGELTSLLGSVLNDDPRPYRKDIKILLNNLIAWTAEYGKKYFHIDRPNVSQRISRIELSDKDLSEYGS